MSRFDGFNGLIRIQGSGFFGGFRVKGFLGFSVYGSGFTGFASCVKGFT